MSPKQEAFLREFGRFKAKVRVASGANFKSFGEGLPATWENYKPYIREHALQLMGIDGWKPKQVGSGTILQDVINAIEIKETDRGWNNLVRWQNRYGHEHRSHHALLDAKQQSKSRTRFERLFFDLYRGESRESDAFEDLRDLCGDRYDLLAYLFFLRDSERFMPIAPRTFDQAFADLEIDVVTARRCSWANYTAYNRALLQVRNGLRTFANISNARLIDAHSFCWMLVRLPNERITDDSGESRPRGKSKKDPGKILGAHERSIWEMAQAVEATVKASLGPAVEKAPKPKELRMTRQQLEAYIKGLLKTQENRCALTGLTLQFTGEHDDAQMLPSLDRIRSDGHYEAGNMQVVCRFINFWKNASDNEEFRRLLLIVRELDD